MKTFAVLVQLSIMGLLCWIAYNTGVGRTLPVHHPSWMSCDGRLSRALFYSTLLERGESLSEVASRVKAASTTDEIDRLVADGSNVNAPRTVWFESVSEPGKCEAQVFLRVPNKDGENTAYIGFDLAGFAAANRGFIEALQGGSVVESIHLDMIGVKWFKETGSPENASSKNLGDLGNEVPGQIDGAGGVDMPAPPQVAGDTASGPSFNCGYAKSPSEKLICSDPDLAAQDRELAALYVQAKAAASDEAAFVRQNASEWHRRESTCADKDCLLAWYANRKAQLSEIVAAGR